MRYFITGTAGFIGFHVARRLLAEGHAVAGYDGLTNYYDPQLKEARHAVLSQFERFTPTVAMLEDASALSGAMDAAEPEIVIHLAAQAGVRYSLQNPQAYIDSNVQGSWNVIDAARVLGVAHLLVASTSSAYGANRTVPFRETDKADEPLTIYAASKRAVELIAHSQSHLHNLPITCFRFFTVYGPWGRPDMALFKFVRAMLADEPIDIYGEGRMSRDFTYIDDLVEAILRLADIPPSEANRVRDGKDADGHPRAPRHPVPRGAVPGHQHRRRPARRADGLHRDDRGRDGPKGPPQHAAHAGRRHAAHLRQPGAARGAHRLQAADRPCDRREGLRRLVQGAREILSAG